MLVFQGNLIDQIKLLSNFWIMVPKRDNLGKNKHSNKNIHTGDLNMKVSMETILKKVDTIRINWTWEHKIRLLVIILVRWLEVLSHRCNLNTICVKCKFQEQVEEKVHRTPINKEVFIIDMDQIIKVSYLKIQRNGLMVTKTNPSIKVIHRMTNALNVNPRLHSGFP